MSSLVVYYSKTGNTKLVANVIRQETDADIIEVKDLKDRKNDSLKVISESINAMAKVKTETDPESIHVDDYDVIYIGTPVWAGSTAPAIYSIMARTDFKNKKVVLFNTMNDKGGYKSIKEMKRLVKENNGKIAGLFSIVASGGHTNIIIRSKQALKDLNLI